MHGCWTVAVQKKANEIVAHLMAKDDERTAVYREYEQGSILLEQVEEYEHQYQVAVQKQEAAFKKVMLAVNDIEKAFSHGKSLVDEVPSNFNS